MRQFLWAFFLFNARGIPLWNVGGFFKARHLFKNKVFLIDFIEDFTYVRATIRMYVPANTCFVLYDILSSFQHYLLRRNPIPWKQYFIVILSSVSVQRVCWLSNQPRPCPAKITIPDTDTNTDDDITRYAKRTRACLIHFSYSASPLSSERLLCKRHSFLNMVYP